LDEARADLDRAVELAPDWELPYLNHAQLAGLRSDWDAAIANYTRAIDLLKAKNQRSDVPMLAKLHWNRAQAYRSSGDEWMASADRREAFRLDPKLAPP